MNHPFSAINHNYTKSFSIISNFYLSRSQYSNTNIAKIPIKDQFYVFIEGDNEIM